VSGGTVRDRRHLHQRRLHSHKVSGHQRPGAPCVPARPRIRFHRRSTCPIPKSARTQMQYLVKQTKGTEAAADLRGITQRTVERYLKGQIKHPRRDLAERPPRFANAGSPGYGTERRSKPPPSAGSTSTPGPDSGSPQPPVPPTAHGYGPSPKDSHPTTPNASSTATPPAPPSNNSRTSSSKDSRRSTSKTADDAPRACQWSSPTSTTDPAHRTATHAAAVTEGFSGPVQLSVRR
jgi:hypothetical protein